MDGISFLNAKLSTINCAPRETIHKATVRTRVGHGNITITTVRPCASSLTYVKTCTRPACPSLNDFDGLEMRRGDVNTAVTRRLPVVAAAGQHVIRQRRLCRIHDRRHLVQNEHMTGIAWNTPSSSAFTLITHSSFFSHCTSAKYYTNYIFCFNFMDPHIP